MSVETPDDVAARADLAMAISMLGRLLPKGMAVTLYRPAEALGDPRVAIETTYPDGEVTRHWFNQLAVH